MGKRWLAVLMCVLLLCGCAGKYPVIYAPDARIGVGETYEADDGVHALDAVDGDLTSQIRITGGELNVQKSGRYRIRYAVTNSRGVSAHASRIVTVSNQSASFRRTMVIVSVICAAALAACIFLWLRMRSKPQEPEEPC